MVADGGELGHDLGDHAGPVLAHEHPDQRRHPRVESFLLTSGLVLGGLEERARVAVCPEQRARAEGRVGQRGRVARRGAAGGAGRDRRGSSEGPPGPRGRS